ncbi:MAG TPA: 2-oxoglutarate dehydrogenase, E2 component, dihydrolipoamide succinyltransferase [Bacteroidetes bacterium]|nr:2-oxoglutarate dehydrogenase, E2 component, dihydrolipoamide succinyltransferase [Bacteroidota bacterium]
MARVEVVMPKMGESIMEGTVIEWTKSVGDTIEQDETLLEIATDKVDSEVPSPASGVLVEILAEVNDTIEVGKVIAIIETDASAATSATEEKPEPKSEPVQEETPKTETQPEETVAVESTSTVVESSDDSGEATEAGDGKFYSPLVRSIAKEEGISLSDLDKIEGTGAQGRVNKQDVLNFIERKKSEASKPAAAAVVESKPAPTPSKPAASSSSDSTKISAGEIKVNWPSENVQVIKMDRMRKLIAEHMVKSKQTSAHVTTFAEADVTNMVNYRERHKDKFFKENGFKLTFTPFFIEATIQALREFPLMNSSIDGENIILKREINYGIAVALGEAGSGGLIVPVLKNAGEMNLLGIARATNELARKARNRQLSPDDLVGGTFTLTNYGSVGNLMGTPIINQPQVAIFGTGAIKKRPIVMETEHGDVIAVRQMVYLSMSYDHRIIDGALGGAFVQRVTELLENFDVNRSI